MYFCAFGLLFLLPVAYLVCQILTWGLYEGKWRRRSLWPIAAFALSFVPLAFEQTRLMVGIVVLGAPIVGLTALAFVWHAYVNAVENAGQADDPDG